MVCSLGNFFGKHLAGYGYFVSQLHKELEKCQGVSKGKAIRYGKPFCVTDRQYVEDNTIEKPDDFVMKSVVNKSG